MPKSKSQATAHFYDNVWQVARRIPKGRVATYGQIATWLGSPRAARAVGYAMFNVKDPEVPWHRVINAKGQISEGGHLHRAMIQRRLLEDEGISFDPHNCVDLRRYGWQGDDVMAMPIPWIGENKQKL
ncbi:MAG: MGMT family protein [Myxococcota bacterium]